MTTEKALQILSSAYNVGATVEERTAGTRLYDELRNGEITSGVKCANQLVQSSMPLEIQILGYSLLQHFVAHRWGQLQPQEKSELAALSNSLLQQNCALGKVYAIRNKSAVFLALIMKRSGPIFVEDTLKRLLFESSMGDPSKQILITMVVKNLADEVYQFSNNITATELRDLLACLNVWLPQILGFIEKVIEDNVLALQNGSKSPEVLEAVKMALEAAAVYAEFAPASEMLRSGLISAANFLLSSFDFRDAACALLRAVILRRKTTDENVETFNQSMEQIGSSLLQVVGSLLEDREYEEKLSFEGQNEEFGLLVCDSIAILGQAYLCIAFPDERNRICYLERMLQVARHPYLPLAVKSLEFWAKLIQESASSISSKDPSQVPSMLPPEAILTLMELASDQLQHRNCRTPQVGDEIPIYFDDFDDYKDFMISYRQKLAAIVRFSACTLPEQSLQATVNKLVECLRTLEEVKAIPDSSLENACAAFEAAAIFAESTVKAVWDGINAKYLSDDAKNTRKVIFCSVLEPIFDSLLKLRVVDARLLMSQAKALIPFSKLLPLRQALIHHSVVNLLEILEFCVPFEPIESEIPPPSPSLAWREGAQARSAIAMVLLEYAKCCPEGFAPHVEEMANISSRLKVEKKIRPGEMNTVAEAILASLPNASPDLQERVINWTIDAIKTSWTSPQMQETIRSLDQFVVAYLPPTAECSEGNQGPMIGGRKERYSLYHEIHMVEKAMKRLNCKPMSEIFSSHLGWIVPVLLQVFVCLNSLDSPNGRSKMRSAQVALDLSSREKAHYLKLGQIRDKRATSFNNSEDYMSVGGATVGSVRAWLRHTREFICHILGLIPVSTPSALEIPGIAGKITSSLFYELENLDHRNLRLILRHVTIPFIKTCPLEFAPAWILPSMSVLAPHMEARLAKSWQSLSIWNDRNDTDASMENFPSSRNSLTEEEVVLDRMIRELTQEYADVLKEIASRTANTKDEKTTQSETKNHCLLQMFLLHDPAGGLAAAVAAVDGMLRPDDAAFRFATFCRALVHLAPQDAALYNYVGTKVLHSSISCLSLEVLAPHQAEILGMIREIIVQQIDDANSSIRSVLTMLPGIGYHEIEHLSSSLRKTGSEKEQRSIIKQFLLQACGSGSFAALADWKPSGVVQVVGTKQRGARITRNSASITDDDEHLQGEITRALFTDTF